eukprot:TRINITY_DN1_c1_g1_i1.p2 TRINITY_DN1_c1_g1~~TRINITY_DN1_c1_g1_i1.p2  ORF type:complete len:280 (-),score=179.42 TRINITY_DN1_c1_g1_i1:124-963(-)
MSSFTEKLDAESLAFFNEVCARPFSQQAVAFLNAYWTELSSQAEFIFSVSWEVIKYADMHSKGISLVHHYEEGTELDFNIGLYFYERLCKFLEESNNAKWAAKEYAISQPEMLTAIKRKQELREKVDVNFDGKVSFLEYLLYQYQSLANPADFCFRSMGQDEHPEIKKARLALEEVSKRIRAFETEKSRLETDSKLPGVKGLTATNLLAQLENNPLKQQLNAALITAEAALRKAAKLFGGGAAVNMNPTEPGKRVASNDGALWWMGRDLEEKKKRYGKK